MPRQRRIDIAGALHHVIVRGIERRQIFCNKHDYKSFLDRLEKGLEKTGCQCLAWALIPNHFHLLVRTGEKSLSALMRSLLTSYAIYFNKKYKRSGYVYQNRYKAILCQEESYLLELVRYIHLNPFRSGIVGDLEELSKYLWCGHSVVLGKVKRNWQNIDDVLMHFGNKKRTAIRGYLRFIEDGLSMGKRDDLTGGGLRRSAGGWEEVKKMAKEKIKWRSDERILGEGDFVEDILNRLEEDYEKKTRLQRKGWNLKKVSENVIKKLNIKNKDLFLRTRKNNIVNARALVCYLGCRELGLTRIDVARYLKMSKQGVAYAVERGEDLAGKYKINFH